MWGVWVTEENEVHVVPSDGERMLAPHCLDLDCVCHPVIEDDGLIVHEQIN